MTSDDLDITPEPVELSGEAPSAAPEEPGPATTPTSSDGPAELDEREDLFDFERAAVPGQAAADDDAFNLDELLDAIATTPDEEVSAEAGAGDAPAPGFAGDEGDIEVALLRRLLSAQPQPASDDPGAALMGRLTRVSPSRVVIAVVVVMTLFNAGVVGLSWRESRGVKDEMLRFADEVVAVTQQIRDDTSQQVRDLEALQGPIVSRDPEYSRAFEKVRELMEAGENIEARRQLYSLLAVLDRLEPVVRADAEARASFLLGDTLRFEALAREERASEESSQ